MERYFDSNLLRNFIVPKNISLHPAPGAFDSTSTTFSQSLLQLFRFRLEINICCKSLHVPMSFLGRDASGRGENFSSSFKLLHFPSFMQQLAPTWLFFCSLTFLSRKLTLIMHWRAKWSGWVSEIELYGKSMHASTPPGVIHLIFKFSRWKASWEGVENVTI